MDVSTGRYKDFLKLTGVPQSTGILLRLLFVMFKLMADNCGVDIVMRDEDEIETGKYHAKIIETPGHSKGSISEVYTNIQVLQRQGKVSWNTRNGLLEIAPAPKNISLEST